MSADKEELRKQLSEKGFSDEEIDKILSETPISTIKWERPSEQ